MKILVTGGTGFLGSHTATELARIGHDVTVLGRNAELLKAFDGTGIRAISTDIRDAKQMLNVTKSLDAVVHCAALSSIWGDYQTFYQHNVVGTTNVVNSCLENLVPRLINISSPSIYFDFRHAENVAESGPFPKRFSSHYAATKKLAEDVVLTGAKRGLFTISLRPRGIYGPGDTAVFPRLLGAIRNNQFPMINGGAHIIDLTHVDNVVHAIRLALNADSSFSGKAYNITDDDPQIFSELIRNLLDQLGLNVRFKRINRSLALAYSQILEFYARMFRRPEPWLTPLKLAMISYSLTLNVDAAKRDLKYQPLFGTNVGISNFVRWYKDQNAAN